MKELADGAKTWTQDNFLTAGPGSAIIDLTSFVTGKSVLVVAGYAAADTKAASQVLLQYDSNADKLTGARIVLKNGVWGQETV